MSGESLSRDKPELRTFYFVARVDCATAEQADQVMTERFAGDEDYGFDYTVDWNIVPEVEAEMEQAFEARS
jgi:hypothetical protein